MSCKGKIDSQFELDSDLLNTGSRHLVRDARNSGAAYNGDWRRFHTPTSRAPHVDPQFGEALTRWTIRLAVACYVGRLLLDLGGAARSNGSVSASKVAMWLWTLGCGFYLIHVLAAFSAVHAWSHHAAYRHTAEATRAVVGIDWGGGLYVNYAFTLFWVTDAVLWWRGGVGFAYRSRAYFWMVHGVFAFMVVNATVVFGPQYWKWVALAVGVVIGAVLLLQNHGQKNDGWRIGE